MEGKYYMDCPKLSIILPIYNGENFLTQAIESVLKSTLHSWELILVNDGSTDMSEKICKEYCRKENRIHYISQDNLGLSAARNTGFSIARGTYVVYLDADDYVERDYYEQLVSEAEKEQADFIVTGFTREFIHDRRNNHITKTRWDRHFLQSADEIRAESQKLYFYNVYIHVWNKIYKRKKLIENNIRFDENIRYGEDVPYNIQALTTAESILFLELSGYHYICHNIARLTNRWNENLLNYNCEIYKRIRLHEYIKWQILDSKVAAGMYLRSCFLAWEKATYNQKFDYPARNKIIRQTLHFEETKEAIEVLTKYKVNIEFEIYYGIIKTKNVNLIYISVIMRKFFKHLLGR